MGTVSRSLSPSLAPPISPSRPPRNPKPTWPIHLHLLAPLQLLRRLSRRRPPPQLRRARASPTPTWASTSSVKRNTKLHEMSSEIFTINFARKTANLQQQYNNTLFYFLQPFTTQPARFSVQFFRR